MPPPIDLSFATPGLTIVVFVLLAAVAVGALLTNRRKETTPGDFYAAGGRLGARTNGLALFSSFIMLTTVFTMTGYISLDGLDALIFAGGFSLSWLFALLFLAEPMRNTNSYTLGDLFSIRAQERPARKAAAVLTLTMFVTYIIITTNAFSIVAEFMLGLPSTAGKSLVVAVAGVLTVLYVYFGGMGGTTRLLIVKAAVVIGVLVALTATVLVMYRFNLLRLVNDAAANAPVNPDGFGLFEPGREYSSDTVVRLGYVSKLFTVVVGAAILPYLFMRAACVRSGVDARRSVAFAGSLMVPFYLCTTVLGFGALGILGGDHVGVLPPTRDITLPTLADRLGGPWLVALVGATALLIVAGMVAALLISATTTYLRDVHRPRHGAPAPGTELRLARRVTLGIGLGSVVLGVILLPVHTHFLIPTTVNFAAAGVLPAVVYTLFWRRFNTSGLRWSVYGGLAVTAVLMFFSVGVSGAPGALFESADWHFIPNADVGLVAVPITFLLGYLGTIRSGERDDAGFAQLQVRALTGAKAPATRSTVESPPESTVESTPVAGS